MEKKLTYLWSQGMINQLAEKVANEKMKDQHIEHMNEVDFAEEVQKDLAEQSKFFAERQSEESARVEIEVDLARERARERIQMEMYDDPYLNWSGHR